MLANIRELLSRLFGSGRKPDTALYAANERFARAYEDANGLNLTAVFAARLATLAVTESAADVSGDNRRAGLLREAANGVWQDVRKITARMMGTGGVVLVPEVKRGLLFHSVVGQDRLIIAGSLGRRITQALLVADAAEIGNDTYYRLARYELREDGVLTITNTAVDKRGNETSVRPWGEMPDVAISGVERMPFAYIKSPADNRRADDTYGVPVTYGCDSLIDEIRECLTQIADEYRLKQVRVFADHRLLERRDTGQSGLTGKLFVGVPNPDNKPLIETFSPDFRDTSQYNRLTRLFSLLEKSVGTSAGILTENHTRAATATEIKASLYDTYAMIESIRKALARGMNDYLYACGVLAGYYGLTPPGDWTLSLDWSYALIENSTETFDQLVRANSMGAVSKDEVRRFVYPSETQEESLRRVGEIAASEPTVHAILGGE